MIKFIHIVSFSHYYKVDKSIFFNILEKMKSIHLKNIEKISIIKKTQIIENSDNILYFGIFNSKCKIIPKYFIHINGDTFHINRYFNDTKIFMDRAIMIIDFSSYNILAINNYKQYWHKTVYIPFGYHEFLEPKKISNISKDIIMFGGKHSNRFRYYHTLKEKGYKIEYPNYIENKYLHKNDIDKCIQESIMGVSILKVTKDCNDLHRIRHFIINKRLFIVQKSEDMLLNSFFEKYDLLCDYQNIVQKSEELILFYKTDSEAYKDKANKLYEEFVEKFNIENYMQPIVDVINNIK
jgi:hypothetical protein